MRAVLHMNPAGQVRRQLQEQFPAPKPAPPALLCIWHMPGQVRQNQSHNPPSLASAGKTPSRRVTPKHAQTQQPWPKGTAPVHVCWKLQGQGPVLHHPTCMHTQSTHACFKLCSNSASHKPCAALLPWHFNLYTPGAPNCSAHPKRVRHSGCSRTAPGPSNRACLPGSPCHQLAAVLLRAQGTTAWYCTLLAPPGRPLSPLLIEVVACPTQHTATCCLARRFAAEVL
jgi:hypothetical protein